MTPTTRSPMFVCLLIQTHEFSSPKPGQSALCCRCSPPERSALPPCLTILSTPGRTPVVGCHTISAIQNESSVTTHRPLVLPLFLRTIHISALALQGDAQEFQFPKRDITGCQAGKSQETLGESMLTPDHFVILCVLGNVFHV